MSWSGHALGFAPAATRWAAATGWRSAPRMGASLEAAAGWRSPSAVQPRRCFNSGENFKHCQDLVQTNDIESFLCLPFLPTSARAAVVAVKAFNVEIARASDKSKNPRAVEMRLQWWNAVLENIAKQKPAEHPLAQALYEAVEDCDLDIVHLHSLVNHRIDELEVPQPPTEKEVFEYAEGTQSAMLYLSLQALGEYEHEGNKLAAKHVGIAMGMCLLLRGTHHHALRNKLWIPKNMTTHFKLSPGSVAKGLPTQELSSCAYEMAMLAQEHLNLAEKAGWNAGALPALYPAAIARIYLEQLAEREYDLMHPLWRDPSEAIRWRMPYALIKNRVLGTF